MSSSTVRAKGSAWPMALAVMMLPSLTTVFSPAKVRREVDVKAGEAGGAAAQAASSAKIEGERREMAATCLVAANSRTTSQTRSSRRRWVGAGHAAGQDHVIVTHRNRRR